MPPKWVLTVSLDVSNFPSSLSKTEVVSAIAKRFSSLDAIQFVGNFARVTFSSRADRDMVMRQEFIFVGDVKCAVRGGGPRPLPVFVYNYPYEGNNAALASFLGDYGEVHSVKLGVWSHLPDLYNGVRIVYMTRNRAIPRNLVVDDVHVKISYPGQSIECDLCKRLGHVARDCPMKGKCLRCGQSGHVSRSCPNPSATPPVTPPVDLRDNELDELASDPDEPESQPSQSVLQQIPAWPESPAPATVSRVARSGKKRPRLCEDRDERDSEGSVNPEDSLEEDGVDDDDVNTMEQCSDVNNDTSNIDKDGNENIVSHNIDSHNIEESSSISIVVPIGKSMDVITVTNGNGSTIDENVTDSLDTRIDKSIIDKTKVNIVDNSMKLSASADDINNGSSDHNTVVVSCDHVPSGDSALIPAPSVSPSSWGERVEHDLPLAPSVDTFEHPSYDTMLEMEQVAVEVNAPLGS